jgi:hypothetical protein
MYTPGEHVEEIISWIAKKVKSKYYAGQEEHGGKLWRKPMLKNLEEEVTDLIVYLQTHEMQQLKLIALLTEATHQDNGQDMLPLVRSALNLILVGNEEGVPEEER